jgi:hypothetical protein
MYAVEMGSGGMVYIPSFIEMSSGIEKLILGDAQTHSMVMQKSTFFFSKIRKVG